MDTKLLIATCIVNTVFTVFLILYLLYMKILSKRVELLENWRDVAHEIIIRNEWRTNNEKDPTDR